MTTVYYFNFVQQQKKIIEKSNDQILDSSTC